MARTTTGEVTYTPNANFVGTDAFTYTNSQGNTATVNVTVSADTTPPANPVINAIETDNIINAAEDDDVLVSGTAEANSTVDITVTDGTNTVTRQVTANGAGVWTIAGNEADLSGFVDGTITVTATATDAAGNTSGVTTVTPVHDAVIATPTLTVDTLVSGTEDNSVTASGTAEAGSTVVVTFTDGTNTVTATVTANGAGVWTLTGGDEVDLSGFNEGAVTVTVVSTDSAGNSASLVSGLVHDSVAPAVATATQTTADTTPALGGTIDDVTATLQVMVNGNTYAATNIGDGTWTLPDNTISPALTDGTYDVTVVATDTAGNVTTSTTVGALVINTVTPDTTPPANPTIDTVVPDEIFNADNTPAVQPSQTSRSSSSVATQSNLNAQQGAVVDAVSGANSLGSIAALGGADGAVLDAVEGANNQRIYFGDKVDNGLADSVGLWDVSGIKGFSVSFSMGELSQGSETGLSLFPLRVGISEVESKDQLIIKSILRDRTIFLEVDYSISSNSNLSAANISVLQVNGSPLPDWLRIDDNGGLVSGEPPIGTDAVELRIEVTLSDGTVIVRYVDVNVNSGEIAALEQIGDEFIAGASLFEHQIDKEAIKFDNLTDEIRKALIN
jgi:hypothetical protein